MKYLRAIIQDPESEMEMKSGAESTQKQEELQQQQQQQQQRHFHVLAVDDSLMDRKLLERQLLKVSSCHVTFVDSGNKALEYLGLMDDLSHVNASSPSSSSFSASSSSQSQPQQQQEQLLQEGIKVNLIITDYCMPGISGYDLLKRIKGSSWKDVPVVVMSSENIPSRISMCLEGGAEEFLLKPLQLSDVEKLQQHLSKPIGHPSGRIGDDFSVNDINSNDKNKKEIISTRLSMSPKSAEIAPK